MKLYEIGYSGISIKEVESEKQTEKSVFINGNRYKWKSYFSSFYKTREEAKQRLISDYENIVAATQKKLDHYQRLLAEAHEI